MQPVTAVTPPGSRFWKIVHFPLILLVVGVALQVAVQALLGALHIGRGKDWSAVPAAVLVALLSVGAYLLFTRFVERRRGFAEFGAAGAGRELGAGLLAGLVLFSVVIGVIALLGGYTVVGTRSATVLAVPVAISIVSGVTEEIIMRGLFFRLIEQWLGSWIALVLSAALFGAAHLGNQHATLLAGTAIALEAGVSLAALYMLTRRLWAVIGLHAAWNFAQGGIYGVAVSGFQMNGLLVPRITGPDLLTGGFFGAEASLPAIVIMTLFGLAVLYAAHTHDRFVLPSWRRRDAGAEPQQG